MCQFEDVSHKKTVKETESRKRDRQEDGSYKKSVKKHSDRFRTVCPKSRTFSTGWYDVTGLLGRRLRLINNDRL